MVKQIAENRNKYKPIIKTIIIFKFKLQAILNFNGLAMMSIHIRDENSLTVLIKIKIIDRCIFRIHIIFQNPTQKTVENLPLI